VSKVVADTRSALPRVPDEIQFLLNDPPLWRGESREEYMALLGAIAKSCGARNDVLHWLLIDEVAHQLWEIRKLRRIEAGLVLKCQVEVIEELLKTTYDSESVELNGLSLVFDVKNDARRWAIDREFAKKVDDRLTARGHDPESIRVKAYERCANELRELENSIAKKENRRRATLMELERRDELFAKRLAEASLEILDAEFSEAAE
jgi:hypothetical protein